jgi:hypothetical protein
MSPRRLKDAHIVAATAILMVLIAGVTAVVGPADAPGPAGTSSFSAAADGGKAAFATLKALGYRIERSYEPMTAIVAEPRRTILVITGLQRPSDSDRRALQEFLNAGGSVLLVGAQGAAFLGLEEMSATLSPGEPVTYRAAAPSPLAIDVREITMARPSGAPKLGSSFVHVFSAGPDMPLVATARIGRGRAIWFAAPTPLANAYIADAGNLRLLLNIAGEPGEREVLWDEHYYGHKRSLWSYAAATPLPWMGAQLGVMMVAVFATYSRRRGPIRSRTTDQRTSPLEFIDMLRALYQRAGAGAAAIRAARTRLQRAVATAYGIPADSPDEAVARVIAAKAGGDVATVLRLLETSGQVNSRELSTAEAVELTRRLQQCTAGVLRPRSQDSARVAG